MIKRLLPIVLFCGLAFTSCDDDDDDDNNNPTPQLTVPSEYLAPDYDGNTSTEAVVIEELSAFATAAGNAEANAQTGMTIDPIDYPATLSSVTFPNYRILVEVWKEELVAAANSPTEFVIPDMTGPDPSEEGGLLGSRLLDEYGLELEQMLEKGSFGAACYNHATAVIDAGDLTAGDIDRLVEIHGTDPNFNPETAEAAAKYSKRRSNQVTNTGYFYDIRDNLITAKAAIEGGSAYNAVRDEALEAYLLNWERSNFATVIYYCNAAKIGIQEALVITDEEERRSELGSALHAYAEGVGFAHGFRGLENKFITDAEIDQILAKLLAPVDEEPETYRFLIEASLLSNFDEIIDDIQAIYGFSDEEVQGFFVNN
ncbi:MAG TPA: hypothetical protein VJ894_03950 [Cryomorphaceae bacterium]|nr:hypothetical protein [Cryomorphaceae bacterium]